MLGTVGHAYSRHLGGRSRGNHELMASLHVRSKSNKGPPEQLSETHLKTKQVLNDYLTKEQQCHVGKRHRDNCPQTKHSTCGEGVYTLFIGPLPRFCQ